MTLPLLTLVDFSIPAGRFKDILCSLKTLSTVNFEFNSNALYVQGMDSSHSYIAETKLTKDFFPKYYVRDDILGLDKIQLMINIPKFIKLLNCTSKNDKLFFKYFKSEKKFNLKIIPVNNDLHKKILNFSIFLEQNNEIQKFNIPDT